MILDSFTRSFILVPFYDIRNHLYSTGKFIAKLIETVSDREDSVPLSRGFDTNFTYLVEEINIIINILHFKLHVCFKTYIYYNK